MSLALSKADLYQSCSSFLGSDLGKTTDGKGGKLGILLVAIGLATVSLMACCIKEGVADDSCALGGVTVVGVRAEGEALGASFSPCMRRNCSMKLPSLLNLFCELG